MINIYFSSKINVFILPTLDKLHKQAVDDKDRAVELEMKDNHLKTEEINIYNKYNYTFLVLVILYVWNSN